MAGKAEQKPRLALVGRSAETVLLRGALQRAATSSSAVALIGEPGIGKTRLATELSEEARASGAIVAWGRAWDAGGAPVYWPWTQLLRFLHEQVGAERFVEACGHNAELVARVVAELANEDATAAPGPSADADRFALFEAIAGTLRRLAAEKTIVAIFDDVQTTDETSVQLIDFVVRRLSDGGRLLIVVCAEASGANSALDPLLGSIAREHVSVPLKRLGEKAIAELCAGVLGQHPDQAVLQTVMDASDGNPLFAIEVLRMIEAQEDPRRPDHSRGFHVPRGVRDLLTGRLRDLTEEARLVLSASAVVGREFDAETVAEACRMDVPTVLEVLAQGIRAGIVREVSSLGRFSFFHLMMREVLYEELAMSDRMRLHAAIAATLENRHRGDIDHHLDEIAHHFYKAAQAGDKNKTIDFALRAARRAMAKMGYEEAVRLYTRALKVSELGGVDGSRRARIKTELKRATEMAEHPGGEPADSSVFDRNLFWNEGDYWTIVFDGTKIRLRDSKGLHYIAQLLKNPGRDIQALDLVAGSSSASDVPAGIEDAGPTDRGSDLGELLDPEARAAYKRRLSELQEELDSARAFNDDERAVRAQLEMDAVVAELTRVTGLGGRSRRAGGDAERARTSVTKAIKGAIQRITTADKALGRHLESTVGTGLYCSYRPDERVPILWSIR